MEEVCGVSKPSSWLTRTHFSRAVCHRTATVVAPLRSLLPPSDGIEPIDTVKGFPDLMESGNRRFIAADVIIDEKDSSEHRWNDGSEQLENDTDFSFPSPFSSINTSWSHASSLLSKSSNRSSFSDRLSPVRDEDMGSGYWSITDSPSPTCFSRRSTMTSSPMSSRSSERSLASIDSFRDNPSIFQSDRNNSNDFTGNGGGKSISRAPSWSQYLQSSGGEIPVSLMEKWMVDLSQLLLGQRFASGTHSRLYKGMYKNSPVAVKIVRQPDENKALADRLERLFTQEVTILSGLRHRNIVQLIAACTKPPALCVITEYLSGSSLRAFLRKRKGKLLPLKQLVSMALDIVCGMEYLHTKGVIHRDLKSENLVLTDGHRVKVVDFGVACSEYQCDFREDDPGTYRWMAPEMICRKQYTRKVDVYSFGIVLWELLTGKVPFEEISPVQAAFAILHKNARPRIPSDCPAALERLMRKCWSLIPDQRPEFWEILRVLQKFEDSLDLKEAGSLFKCSPECNTSLPGWLQC